MSSLLLLLPSNCMSRLVVFLDRAELLGLKQCSHVFYALVQLYGRVASGEYAVCDGETGMLGLKFPKHPWMCPWQRIKALEGFYTETEFWALMEFAFLEAKLLTLSTRNVGSLVVSGMVERMLPPNFSEIEHICAESIDRLDLKNEDLKPLATNAERKLLYLEQKDDDENMQDDDNDEENQGLEPPPAKLPHQQEVIKMIIGVDVGSRFYHLKQDCLNSIVDVIENQYLFCTKVLRFSPFELIAPNVDGTTFAVQVAAVARNQFVTPERVKSLYQRGFFYIDNFLPIELVRETYIRCGEFVQKTRELLETSSEDLEEAYPGGPPPFLMSRGTPYTARGDLLLWLNRDHAPGSQMPFTPIMDLYSRLYEELAGVVKLTGFSETQLAFYPDQGEGYRRHRDATPDDGTVITDNRRVTAIIYCNPQWQPDHGGRLRMWLSHLPGKPVVDLEPLPGRILVFLSGLIDHEVRPSFHARVATTTWMW